MSLSSEQHIAEQLQEHDERYAEFPEEEGCVYSPCVYENDTVSITAELSELYIVK